jgi:uncharacterized protein (UPF0335 family)
MTAVGGIAPDILKQYIERIERLELEKMQITENIRDIFAAAKIDGFDPKVMRQVIKIRKMDAQERNEQEALLDTYQKALGMLPDFE